MNWDECLEHAEQSDIGMRRATNQDSHRVVLAPDWETWLRRGHLFVVADGMGAHAAGELASDMAAAGIVHQYHKYEDLSAPEALHRAILETNAEIHRRGQANVDFHNMGTTGSVLALLPQGALVAHVGDSRVYRLRKGVLEQLTFDHSLVWELRANGQLSSGSDWAGAVPKNIITRSLGPNPTVQADFEGPFPLEAGDAFVLCSDGLTGPLTDEEIGAIVDVLQPKEAAQTLIDLANLRGGPDNITVLVVRITGETLTTANASGEPLRLKKDKRQASASPVLWIVAAVCVLAALAMFLVGQTNPALVALGGGVIALLSATAQSLLLRPRGVVLGAARRLGKGPHRQFPCPVDQEVIATFQGYIEQLQDAIDGTDWALDVESFDRLCRSAAVARDRGALEIALVHYAQAISFMMAELRNQHGSNDSGPSIFGP